GLRPSPETGKKDLLILDHSDTHLRLGFVTDIVHGEMSRGRMSPVCESSSARLPKECPRCKFVKPFGVRLCSMCGYETSPPPPIKEYTKADLEKFNGKKKRDKKDVPSWTIAEKAIFYAELKRYGIDKGYAPGWSANKYRLRLEVWPCPE